ncbi:MAG: DUF4215 domain-containing protein, partial [Nannocystaceae bacterium]
MTTTTGLPTTTNQPTTSTTSVPTSDTTDSETLEAGCGNGVVDDGEECDDGNALNDDACLDDCTPASCGDGYLFDGAEECDDGNMDPHDDCLNDCTQNKCGDGIIHDGVELCDDANALNTDHCLNNCTVATCGDSFVNTETEKCDDGVNNGQYGSCSSDCTATMPACGDGTIDDMWGENCDGDPELDGVLCDPVVCRLDFTNVNQLFCRGFCTWDAEFGCQQADADIFCRLLTQNPNSEATDYDTANTLAEPGFACSDANNNTIKDMQGLDPRVNLGPLPEYGVNHNPLFYQSGSLKETHGATNSDTDVIINPV